MKSFLRKFSLYWHLFYIWRATVIYKKPFSYLWHRYFVGPRIRRLSYPLDRPPKTKEFSIHLLCSHKDITMLLWALASWYSATSMSGPVYIHEDGSFTTDDRQLIARLLPYAKIVDYGWAKKQIDKWLLDHPCLSKFRREDHKYIFAIKLLDPYFVSDASSRLILDTDVLWFASPEELLEKLREGKAFIMDGKAAMDYKFSDGSFLALPIRALNSGIVGYRVDSFSIDTLEEFCRKNGPDNPSRVIEQAAYAYVLEKSGKLNTLPDITYSLKLRDNQAARHYTGPVREQYWFEGVRKVKNRILK